ncbi:MAG: ABC transporter ATP-binding protein [Clostridia bacterium]|nr:ABC transporter ATP-binding protein [Clostridia bacterium]
MEGIENGIEIENLTVDFGNFKLDCISLGIKKGCITGLVGRNGAGKSTLIKTIMRQQSANAGSILYNGKKFLNNEVEILNSIACVFDTPHFNINFKPKRILKLYTNMYEKFDTQLYAELMQKFNLPEKLRFSKYSYGMQRKYCLILALCQKADILILDEPTSGVDPVDRNEVVGLIQEYLMNEEHTVLFSTHITEDLDRIADYIVMMENGKITMDMEKDVLTDRYRLVQCGEMTDDMRASAIGIKHNAFGYTFLTMDKTISGEGIQVKVPTVEEIFIHTQGDNSLYGGNGGVR